MQCERPTTLWVKCRVGRQLVHVCDDDLRVERVEYRPRYEWRQILARCGKCYTCLESRARFRAQQAHAEFLGDVALHALPLFVTLTYDELHIPPSSLLVDGHLISPLVYSHFRQFIRSIRQAGYNVRFFGCGEYGPSTSRPHYHVILYSGYPRPGIDDGFVDLYDVRDWLLKYWPRGNIMIAPAQPVHFDYCASYVTKKSVSCNDSIPPSARPFVTSSTKPPLGYGFYYRNVNDILRFGYCQHGGKRFYPPRGFFLWLKRHDKKFYDIIQLRRANSSPDITLYSSRVVDDYKAMREHLWSAANDSKHV